MGCQPTKCRNCLQSVKACEIVRAKDGKSCCTKCIKAYKETLKQNQNAST